MSAPRRLATALQVAFAVLLLVCAPLAAQSSPVVVPAAGPAPRHEFTLLGLFVSPTDDVVDEVYGAHAGVGLRYGLRLSARWALEAELGQRQADGTTATLGVPADLEVRHAALLGAYRWGPGVARRDRWTVALGAGVLWEGIEEAVRFPDETARASETLLGALLRAGLRWPLRPSWGFTAEARLSLPEDASPPAPGVDPAGFGAFELAGGVFLAF